MKRRAIPISWDDASFSSSPADFLLELDLHVVCVCVLMLFILRWMMVNDVIHDVACIKMNNVSEK